MLTIKCVGDVSESFVGFVVRRKIWALVKLLRIFSGNYGASNPERCMDHVVRKPEYPKKVMDDVNVGVHINSVRILFCVRF